jgi:hypothetical protein
VLAQEHAVCPEVGWTDSLRDVDIYLAVARALLASDNLKLPTRLSVFGQDASVDRILSDIESLVLQTPTSGGRKAIYGRFRYVDYSQFKRRGHYTENSTLQQYSRCMKC